MDSPGILYWLGVAICSVAIGSTVGGVIWTTLRRYHRKRQKLACIRERVRQNLKNYERTSREIRSGLL